MPSRLYGDGTQQPSPPSLSDAAPRPVCVCVCVCVREREREREELLRPKHVCSMPSIHTQRDRERERETHTHRHTHTDTHTGGRSARCVYVVYTHVYTHGALYSVRIQCTSSCATHLHNMLELELLLSLPGVPSFTLNQRTQIFHSIVSKPSELPWSQAPGPPSAEPYQKYGWMKVWPSKPGTSEVAASNSPRL